MIGVAFLYSTSPSPHELLILKGPARRATSSGRPIRAVALQTPLEDPSDLAGLEQHFCTQGLEVQLADSGLHTREDAFRAEVIARLADADLVLITGGSPHRILEATADTPALAALRTAHENGAAIAGCSAGAAVLGAGMVDGPRSRRNALPLWGWLHSTLVAPHFGQYDLDPWLDAFPTCNVLGIPDGAMAQISQLRDVEVIGLQPLTLVERRQTGPVTTIVTGSTRLP